MDGWTDIPSYRDACTHLKTQFVEKCKRLEIQTALLSLLQTEKLKDIENNERVEMF